MKSTGKVLVSVLLFAGAGGIAAEAAGSEAAIYHPAQGLSYRFGSKLAAGFFLQRDGACALSIFLAENAKEDMPPSRLQVKVAPGDNVKLNSTEGAVLEIKCGAQGATMEVKQFASPR